MTKQRTTTAIRLEPENHEGMRQASEAFGLTMNFLINYAVREFLADMIDPAEFKLTKPAGRKGETRNES